MPPRTPARRRRPPEEARRLLLDAAESLIAERGPDGVTLRDVAEAVGVTPGLVTHYFGTYAGLAREVLHRQDDAAQAQVARIIAAAAEAPEAEAILGSLFEAVAEPRRIRLFAWSRLHGGGRARRSPGLRGLVDALEAAFRRTLPAAEVPARARIEQVTLLALAATHGYAIGKGSWVRQLGLGQPTRARDRDFLAALTRALRLLMATP